MVSGSEAHALVDAAVARGETVGVAFIEPEQVSLFNAGLHCAVNTSEGKALFEDDEGCGGRSRASCAPARSALDVKREVHRVYPADTAEIALVEDAELMGMRARSTWDWRATC